jgi:hypothetical protein
MLVRSPYVKLSFGVIATFLMTMLVSAIALADQTPTPTATATPHVSATATPTVTPSVPHDNRYFSETGFRIDNDTIWDYFNRRGGVVAFGYPISRTFLFQGFPVQFFQLWGIPTSQPTFDPNNHSFVYLRFQRGITMYDAGCNCTRGVLLLGDI